MLRIFGILHDFSLYCVSLTGRCLCTLAQYVLFRRFSKFQSGITQSFRKASSSSPAGSLFHTFHTTTGCNSFRCSRQLNTSYPRCQVSQVLLSIKQHISRLNVFVLDFGSRMRFDGYQAIMFHMSTRTHQYPMFGVFVTLLLADVGIQSPMPVIGMSNHSKPKIEAHPGCLWQLRGAHSLHSNYVSEAHHAPHARRPTQLETIHYNFSVLDIDGSGARLWLEILFYGCVYHNTHLGSAHLWSLRRPYFTNVQEHMGFWIFLRLILSKAGSSELSSRRTLRLETMILSHHGICSSTPWDEITAFLPASTLPIGFASETTRFPKQPNFQKTKLLEKLPPPSTIPGLEMATPIWRPSYILRLIFERKSILLTWQAEKSSERL